MDMASQSTLLVAVHEGELLPRCQDLLCVLHGIIFRTKHQLRLEELEFQIPIAIMGSRIIQSPQVDQFSIVVLSKTEEAHDTFHSAAFVGHLVVGVDFKFKSTHSA